MSLKMNIAANYVSQIFVTLIGILILPLYIKYLGAEAYGLIAFFTMLQAFFNLLDLGLTPTISRETARYRAGTMAPLKYRQLYRALSIIFLTIALLGGGGLWILSDSVAARWLNTSELPLESITVAVEIMSVSIALRWMGGLYRGIITGSEKLVWLSGFNIAISTLRFIAIFASLAAFGFTTTVFFTHQLIVAVLEISGLFFLSGRLLPRKRELPSAIGWSFRPVLPLLSFALTIGFTASIWVLVTQIDRLLLSGILTLSEYGYFALAVLAAGGINILGSPIGVAIMPRLTHLYAENKHAEFIQVYRNATQLVVAITGAAAITLAFCSYPLLYAWTGDTEIAVKSARILQLYAIGNGLLAVSGFPYYLQYARGKLWYHLIGHITVLVLIIPAVIYAATNFGGIGAAYTWVSMNVIYMVVWVPYVHGKLEPGLHVRWVYRDVISIGLPGLIGATMFSLLPIDYSTRTASLVYVLLFSALVASCTLLSMPRVRQRIFSRSGR